MSRKARKFKGFFRPKLGDLQKKKKRSSPKFRAIFLPISQVQTFEGGLFSYGGGLFSIFFGARAPPAPPLATLLYSRKAKKTLDVDQPHLLKLYNNNMGGVDL